MLNDVKEKKKKDTKHGGHIRFGGKKHRALPNRGKKGERWYRASRHEEKGGGKKGERRLADPFPPHEKKKGKRKGRPDRSKLSLPSWMKKKGKGEREGKGKRERLAVQNKKHKEEKKTVFQPSFPSWPPPQKKKKRGGGEGKTSRPLKPVKGKGKKERGNYRRLDATHRGQERTKKRGNNKLKGRRERSRVFSDAQKEGGGRKKRKEGAQSTFGQQKEEPKSKP